jgi:hypothetical protein
MAPDPEENHRVKSAVVSIGLVVLAFVGTAQAMAESTAPKAVACTFTEGTTRSLSKGQFKAETPGSIRFEVTAIDLDAATAVLRTARGAAPVRLVRAVNAFHVLEVVTEGFLNVTTIYDRDDALGGHPAAHSRHVAILGQPVISHYVGMCKAM